MVDSYLTEPFNAKLSLYCLGHFMFRRYIKCHLILVSNVKMSVELPEHNTLSAVTPLLAASAQQYSPLHFIPTFVVVVAFFFSSLLLKAYIILHLHRPFSFCLSLKNHFCKFPLPQVYSRKTKRNKKSNNFFIFPRDAHYQRGAGLNPILNK